METNLESVVVMQQRRIKFYALTMDALQRCTECASGLGFAEYSCLVIPAVLILARRTIYNGGIILDSTTRVVEGQFLQMFLRD